MSKRGRRAHNRVPHYPSEVEWARMKERNGYALTPTEQWLLGRRKDAPQKAEG